MALSFLFPGVCKTDRPFYELATLKFINTSAAPQNLMSPLKDLSFGGGVFIEIDIVIEILTGSDQ